VKLKNVPRNVPRYSRRVLLHRQNSSPFLSGDLFADHADVQMYPPLFRGLQPSRRKITEARVIFCPSDRIEQFLNEYSGSIFAKVLILGNGDRDFENFEFPLPSSINGVFVQNLSFQSERFRILPIGIENLRLAVNGFPKFFDGTLSKIEKKERVLIGPYSPTHQERDFYKDLSMQSGSGFQILRGRLEPDDYAEISSHFKYVAAPRGNGLDTHRFWETLYRGSIPVVSQSIWSTELRSLGIPLIEIDEWSFESLEKIPGSEIELFDPKLKEILWWDYWRREIKSFL